MHARGTATPDTAPTQAKEEKKRWHSFGGWTF